MTRISDRVLIARLETLAARERATTLSVLLHLNEVERRGLHLSMGYASMFDFATKRLGYSASAAGRRVQVARCIRKHPEIVALLRRNEVNLTSIGIIGRVITAENSATLLDAIRGKSQREVEALAAAYSPMIRIRDRVSPVSLRAPGSGNGRLERREDASTPGLFEPHLACVSVGAESNANGKGVGSKTGIGNTTGVVRGADNRTGCETGGSGIVEEKFRFQYAAGPEFVRKFEAVRALLSTRFPKGASFEEVFEATLDLFLERHSPEERSARRERRRTRTRSPEHARRTESFEHVRTEDCERVRTETFERVGTRSASREPRTTRSRHVPSAVRDAVYARDRGQCTYVGADGCRCSSTHQLQIDHVTPFARGGPTTTENLRLLCAAHNGLEAERAYGSDWMRRFREGTGQRTPDPCLASATARVADWSRRVAPRKMSPT